ncbi:HET-domain-containing protein [Hypomontagnella monticulosa]|nr:HET-domain-containing protein [Hypomontagnella monticulosa]
MRALNMDALTTGHLCDRCQVLQFDDSVLGAGTSDESGGYFFRNGGPDHHPFLKYDLRDHLPDLPVLSKSAQHGCDFCNILRISVLKDAAKRPEQELRVRLQLIFSPEGRFMSVLARVKLQLGDKGENEILFMFGADGKPGQRSTEWLRLQSSPQEHVMCGENVGKICDILQDVDSNEETGAPFYPTRLIQVGTREDDICRLVETHSGRHDQQTTYAALSYCWGPPEDAKTQFMTERATFQDRIAGFQPKTTSRAMQDAIEVCRTLGIPYLWIDAVCIIQDDKEDWERESADMARIYQNAHLTICTPTSASCREGFLEPRISATIGFRSKINSGIVGSYSLRPCGVVSDIQIAEGDYERIDNGDTSPRNNWWKRGWTFQELALSRRVLLFGIKLHLIFKDSFWSEGDETLTEAVAEGAPTEGWGGTFAVIAVSDTLEAREQETMWMGMVEQYTARQLTYESDKLPAMAGLAKLAVLGRDDLYLAGIRMESLHLDLFWTPAVSEKPQTTFYSLLDSLNAPKQYIAPSWSWARWRGKIRFDESPAPYGDHVPVMESEEVSKAYENVEAQMSTSKLNPFGRVTEGSLQLTGTVVPLLPRLERQGCPENSWEMYNEKGEYVANLTFDWDEPRNWLPIEKLSLVLIGSYWSWRAYKIASIYEDPIPDFDEDDDVEEMDVDMDPDLEEEDDDRMDDSSSDSEDISFEEAVSKEPDVDKFAYGLILHPAKTEGKYLRVGIFSSWPREGGGLRKFFGNRGISTVHII